MSTSVSMSVMPRRVRNRPVVLLRSIMIRSSCASIHDVNRTGACHWPDGLAPAQRDRNAFAGKIRRGIAFFVLDVDRQLEIPQRLSCGL